MNILRVPHSIVQFLHSADLKSLICERAHQYLPLFLAGFILSTEKRTQATLANATHMEQVDKSTVSRILRLPKWAFKSREAYKRAMGQALARLFPHGDKPVTWLVAIDGTATKRGAFTKIAGANQFKEKKTDSKGRSTKAHTWLMGVVITDKGVRIPLPRYICFPKDYKGPGRPPRRRLTQQDLTVMMIKDLLKLLPKNIKLVVVADEYFEGKKLFKLAKRRGFVCITPCKSSRCFADDETPDRSNGIRIHDRGMNLSSRSFSSFSEVVLTRGSEDTASYRRYGARRPGPNDYRCYWARHEGRTVTGLGPVGCVYSWKSPVFERNNKDFEQMTFKVLLCSDPDWVEAKVIEWYECRWTAIEIFFRELKQELGLGDYVGQDIAAFERHVDLVLMSFLQLELNRLDVIDDDGVPEEIRKKAHFARTRGMRELVRWEAMQDLWGEIKKSWRSERARRRLRQFFGHITALPDTITIPTNA